ncbi:MAG: deoxyribodipyrimidine photolyase-related protein [Bradymonadia bacterium]|jgi:deoxyribodipyrimidine photolyase-related protein
MTKPAFFIGPWDLHRDLACVPNLPADGSVLFVESVAKGQAMPYHRQKLVLVLAAQHHFAEELRAEGYDVTIVNAATYVEGIAAHVAERGSSKVVAMQPREWGLAEALRHAEESGVLGAPLELHDDGGTGGHFLLTRAEFADWAKGRKSLRMDTFYRWTRARGGWLMEGDKPIGGKWSLDAENRKPVRGVTPPAVPSHPPSEITREIMDRVATWPGHWGDLEGFDWPVTREAALRELDSFFDQRAHLYGDHQDAMLSGEPFMWHARISAAMNLSLLHPREVVDRAIDAWQQGLMPLNAAEGFVRQIVGWREFIRGVYWHRMPEMREANGLGAHRPLPNFYWEPEKTSMRCVRESAGAVQQYGYAHHIQRLMVLGNFALLAGISPIQVSHWFWAGFVDAFEWVELPNVHGMALFADDTFTTKPYAASASYINKMSNYCSGCEHDRKVRVGPNACPFNHLFWSFMAKHRERLKSNYRLAALYRTWDRWEEAHRQEILSASAEFLHSLTPADYGWTFDDDAC